MMKSVSGRLNFFYITLCLILLVSTFLRFYKIDAHGIWWDEKISLCNSSGLFAERSNELGKGNEKIIKKIYEANAADDGGNGFFYQLLLHYWSEVFGKSDLALRSFSALAGIMVVVLIYGLAKTVCESEKVALFASFLGAFHPLLVQYSQEARSYEFTTLLTLISTYLFYQLLKTKPSESKHLVFQLISYSLITFLAIWSHYFAVYIFCGHGLFVLINFGDKVLLKRFAIAFFIVTLCCSFWMFPFGMKGMALNIYEHHEFIKEIGTNSFVLPASILNILKGIFQVLLQHYGNNFQNFGIRLTYLIPYVFVPLFIWIRVTFSVLKGNRNVLLLLILSLSSIVFSIAAAIKAGYTISFGPIYGNFSAPYSVILMAWVVWDISPVKRILRDSLLTFFFGIMIVSLVSVYGDIKGPHPVRTRNPYEELAAVLKKSTQKIKKIGFPDESVRNLTSIYVPEIIKVDYEITTFYDLVFIQYSTGEQKTFSLKNRRY